MTTFVIFALGGIGTYLLRIAVSVSGRGAGGSAWIERHISLVSPAILAAIVASAVLLSDGQINPPNIVVIAAIGCGAYAVHRTGNIAASLAVGLPIYWIGALAGFV